MNPKPADSESENQWTSPDGKQYVAQARPTCLGCGLARAGFDNTRYNLLGSRGCGLAPPNRPKCGFSERKDGVSVIWKEKLSEPNPL